ncbi:hypothetical protein MMMDOFMJ_0412 [Methylobacterium gnaphalii]|nr:hypothetical protein MMMDOFMJ_0412 [Methylobacterium gnaphalii]
MPALRASGGAIEGRRTEGAGMARDGLAPLVVTGEGRAA